MSVSHFVHFCTRSSKKSQSAATSHPGMDATRFTAGPPRTPMPTNPTRILFIGATLKPYIGAPSPPPIPAMPPLVRQPAAAAATPIHAVPFRNSLRDFSIVFSPFVKII